MYCFLLFHLFFTFFITFFMYSFINLFLLFISFYFFHNLLSWREGKVLCALTHQFTFHTSCYRTSRPEVFLKLSQYSQENTCLGVCFWGLQGCSFIKKRLQDRCFLWYCKIFKNTCFEEHLRTVGSAVILVKPAWNFLRPLVYVPVKHI